MHHGKIMNHAHVMDERDAQAQVAIARLAEREMAEKSNIAAEGHE